MKQCNGTATLPLFVVILVFALSTRSDGAYRSLRSSSCARSISFKVNCWTGFYDCLFAKCTASELLYRPCRSACVYVRVFSSLVSSSSSSPSSSSLSLLSCLWNSAASSRMTQWLLVTNRHLCLWLAVHPPTSQAAAAAATESNDSAQSWFVVATSYRLHRSCFIVYDITPRWCWS